MDLNFIQQLLGIVGGVASTVALITWVFATQLAKLKSLFFDKIDQTFEKIMSKLEYHERHDDTRFSEIRDDLAEIRIRNAYVDARLGKVFDQEAKEIRQRRPTRASLESPSVS